MQNQTQYVPCPNFGQTNAKPINYTWWGGVIGPKMLSHVKCQNCRDQYNGKTGKPNTQGIIIYSVVLFALVFCMCGGLAAVNVFLQNQ